MGDENKNITGIDNVTETNEAQKQTETVESTQTIVAEEPPKQKKTENRCPKCQALVPEGQAFCHECGTPLKTLCPNCKNEIQEGQTFCTRCGCQITDNLIRANVPAFEQYNLSQTENIIKKSKAKIVLTIIGIIALVLLVALYFLYQNHLETEYKQNAKEFCITTLSAAANLEDIGNTVRSEWHDYIYSRWSPYYSVDSAVAGGLKKMATEVDSAKTHKEKIDALYSNLKKGVGKSEEIAEIKEAVGDLYYAYCDMYDCIINPTGNYTSFSSEFSSVDDSTNSAYKRLNDLLN